MFPPKKIIKIGDYDYITLSAATKNIKPDQLWNQIYDGNIITTTENNVVYLEITSLINVFGKDTVDSLLDKKNKNKDFSIPKQVDG